MGLRVLTWNLKHGRAVPGAGRHVLGDFAQALADWPWDVALLQEVPPWWPPALGSRAGAQARLVLTSRNAMLALRRLMAERWPDVMKSNGGGANAILVRDGEVLEHRTHRLCWWPERRWMHAVRVQGRAYADGLWVANLHATAHDTAAAVRDTTVAAQTVIAWAVSVPLVLGGDLNLREPALEGLRHAGGHDVDHVFIRGLQGDPAGSVRLLDRGRLSDHAPVLATF